MDDEIWQKIRNFIGELIGENVNRKDYVRNPEFEAATERYLEEEEKWEKHIEVLPEEEQKWLEEYKETVEIMMSEQEKRSYVQGYIDCVQVLWHLGLLINNDTVDEVLSRIGTCAKDRSI